jgi:hypothetical protein
LKTLSETRWSSRADSLYTFKTAFHMVVLALEELEEDGDSKARGHACSVKRFDFVIALYATEHVLQSTVALSNMLQRVNMDLVEAANEATVVVEIARAERNDPAVWDQIYADATEAAAELDVLPCRPRLAWRQQHRANVPAESPKQYWQHALY